MITLIASIAGFLGSMLPEGIKIIRERDQRKYNLELIKLQMEKSTVDTQNKSNQLNLQADISEQQELYRTYKSGVHWVDALNGSVRPVVAYSFFILYAFMKIFFMINSGASPWTIWGDEDQVIFTAVISFYFGQRAMRKK